MTTAKNTRRLGRPPAAESADTRKRILAVGRQLFAERGYEATTNKNVAAEAGITAGALYHYFPSKLDIYVAVHDATQASVYERLTRAADEADETFVAKIVAVLDEARNINDEDPSFARFLGSVRVDITRHRELAAVLGSRRDQFFGDIVDLGVRTGEISKRDRDRVLALVITTVFGLTDVAFSTTTHRAAVEGFERLLQGDLISPPKRRRR